MEDDPTRPNAEAAVETDEITELLAFERRFDLIKQLSEYAEAMHNGRIKSGLLPYQVPAFVDTVKFFEKHAQELNATDQLTISGYLDLPTSFGKSVIMAKLAEAFGIGKTPEGRARKRKALILVPSQEAVTQTMGELDEEGDGGGFAKHAAGIATCAYYQFGKDLDADVVVMTYRSFLAFTQRIASGQVVDPDFDLIMCDEAQHTLGPEISMALDAYRQGKIAIGLTATPEYDEDRNIKHIFEHCIHKSELLPLVESGVLNGVQLIGLATGNVIKTVGRGEFSASEFQPLVKDEDRNLAIVQMAQRLIAEGRRGVINALPGERAEHANLLVGMLNGQEITSTTGEPIIIRAATLSSFIDIKKRREILKDYKEGKIHVLAQVKALNENWDEDDVSFIINAAATSSKVVAYQRIGRGMRPNDNWPITVVVELLDEIIGRKKMVTAWDVFGEDEYEQGKVFTTPERRERAEREHRTSPKKHMGGTALADQDVMPPAGTGEPAETPPNDWLPDDTVHVASSTGAGPFDHDPTSMPPAQPTNVEEPPARRLTFDIESFDGLLRERLDNFTVRISRELTIKRQESIGPPKPGWIELASLAGIAEEKGMGIYALRSAIMNEGGFGCELAETPAGDRYYVEHGALQFAIDYEPLPWAPSNYKSAADMEREFGATRQVLDSLIYELTSDPTSGFKGVPMRSRTIKRKLLYFSPAEQKIIKSRINAKKAEMPDEDNEDIVFLSDIATQTKVVRGPIQFFLIRHHGIKGEERRSPKTNKRGMSYTRAEADIAIFHFSHQEIPKHAKLLEHLEQATNLSEEDIRARVEERKLEDIIKRGRFADARGDYHYTLFCANEDFERAILLLTQTEQPSAADTSPPTPIAHAAPREELLGMLAATKKRAPPTNTEPRVVQKEVATKSATPTPTAKSAEQQPTLPAHPTTPPPPTRPPRVAQRQRETLAPSSTAVPFLGLLGELRCNPAAARFLLRQMPFVAGAIRESSSGQTFVEAYAVHMLRVRCSNIGAPPKSCRSDRYFAERFGRKLSEVHGVVKEIMPGTNQIGLFRTDDGSNVITLHYVSQLANQIENVMRKRYGPPK